jgi:hypothetical protein
MSHKKKRGKNHCNRHHIIPSSRGGKSGLENIAIIDKGLHEDYHILFENKTPYEILDYLTNYFWKGNLDYVQRYYEAHSPQQINGGRNDNYHRQENAQY